MVIMTSTLYIGLAERERQYFIGLVTQIRYGRVWLGTGLGRTSLLSGIFTLTNSRIRKSVKKRILHNFARFVNPSGIAFF